MLNLLLTVCPTRFRTPESTKASKSGLALDLFKITHVFLGLIATSPVWFRPRSPRAAVPALVRYGAHLMTTLSSKPNLTNSASILSTTLSTTLSTKPGTLAVNAKPRPNHAARVYDSILDLLPNEENPSPLVRVQRFAFPGSVLYAKLEWMNPFGSVKDRAASEMIDRLEQQGLLGLQPSGKVRGIVEPTSGNTGLSLAGICAARGYPMRAVVPAKVPREKKTLLRIAGADVDVVADALCPLPGTEDGTIGMAKSHARASSDRYLMPNQYENPANADAHFRTTGPEIWRQTEGKVSHVFLSLGTCGTVTGLSKFLKAKNLNIKIIAVQPSPGHDVPGLRNVSELGVSKLYDPALIDGILEVDYRLAYQRALELCQREGLFAGPSSGLIYEGARVTAARTPVTLGVAIFCDSIFKYTSTMEQHLPELASDD